MGQRVAMKIKTAPLLPASDFKECSAPFVSGNLKSSITVPIVGGVGTLLSLLPLPATAARTITRREARIIETAYCFFMRKTPFEQLNREGQIISRKVRRGKRAFSLQARRLWRFANPGKIRSRQASS